MKLRSCQSRISRTATLLVLILSILSWPARAQFTLASLNTLHLGWGSMQAQGTKNLALRNFFAGNQEPNQPFDVIVLQEVMRQADLAALVPAPPGLYMFESSDLMGPGSYKESYAFLVRRNAGLISDMVVWTTDVLGFCRPPSGIIIMETNNANRCTWVVNYHAIFGRSINQRLAEARLIPQVIRDFAGTGCQRVVIAGDWNLPADRIRQAFPNPQNVQIQPNTQTSLKRNGQLSQPYDHFLAANGATLNHTEVIFQGNQQADLQERRVWRQDVSDHLPITCTVN